MFYLIETLLPSPEAAALLLHRLSGTPPGVSPSRELSDITPDFFRSRLRFHVWFVHAEANDASEAKALAPKEEEAAELSSRPSTQVERRVVSGLALPQLEGQQLSWISRGSFSACLFQDILNHVLNDIEVVMGQVGAALAKKATKKKKNGGNSKRSKPVS